MTDIKNQIQKIKVQLNYLNSQFNDLASQTEYMGLETVGLNIQNMGVQIINIGIQILNNGLQIPTLGFDVFNLKQQIKNIGTKIQTLNNQINNNGMGNQVTTNFIGTEMGSTYTGPKYSTNTNYIGRRTNNNIDMGITNNYITNTDVKKRTVSDLNNILFNNVEMYNTWGASDNDSWLKKYSFDTYQPNNSKVIKAVFKTKNGFVNNLNLNEYMTVHEMLIKYLEVINKPYYMNNNNIFFNSFNNKRLRFGDPTIIKDISNNNYIRVFVNIVIN